MTDDLTLSPDAPRRARKRSGDASTPAPSVRLEQQFKAEFERCWGFPPIMNPPRDRKLLKTLVDQWDEAIVSALIPFFFTTTDPEVRRSRFYNVPDFYYWAPKLRRLQNGSGPVHERTAANINEIAKAMGRDKRDNKRKG